MMNNNSQFKNFLQQSFDNQEVGNSYDSWEKINGRLSFQNYFKFGIKHVNIYNTSLGAGLLFFLYFNVFANIFNPELNITNKIAVAPIQKKQITTPIKSSKPNTYKYIPISNSTFISKKYTSQPAVLKNEPFSNGIIALTENETVEQEINTNEKDTNNQNLEILQSKNVLLGHKNYKLIAICKQKSVSSSNEPLKKFEKPHWAIDLFTIPVFSDAMAINNSQYETIKQKVAAGFALKCMYKKYLLETGFVYRSQSKNFNQTTYEDSWVTVSTIETRTNVSANIFTGKIKTTIDTITNTKKQFNSIEKNTTAINTYTTMEIPIYLGYKLNYRKFASTSKMGLVMYVNKTAVGKAVQSFNGSIVELSNIPVTTANYMFSLSNSFCYKIRGPVNIFAEPYLKISLNDPKYNDLSIGSNKFTYGLKMGIEINL
jgi:hypothetical protein